MKLLPNNLEAIIFDLGGVVLNLDPQRTIETFVHLTGFSPEKVIEAGNHEFFKLFEKGQIDSATFRSELNKIFNASLSDEAIDTAWNAMLLDIPKDRMELIASLHNKYNTFVLSNTNDIHIVTFEEKVRKVADGNPIDNYFNKVYYSNKVGMRKPDAEIFELVLKENSLLPSKTLFIDDTLEHIESANRLGLHTWHLTDQEELFAVFGNE